MSGNIRFEGEEEVAQTEALAGRMVTQVGMTNSFVGKRITAMQIDRGGIEITVDDGARIKVVLGNGGGVHISSVFSDNMRAENELQGIEYSLLSGKDPVREEGERIMDEKEDS